MTARWRELRPLRRGVRGSPWVDRGRPTLPQSPLLEGYEETPPEIVLRSTVDAGPQKVRRRFTANIGLITCRYEMTKPQVARSTTSTSAPAGGGSVVFEWPHPWRPVTVRARFREPRAIAMRAIQRTPGPWASSGDPAAWDARVRTLSAAARAALFAGETEQIFLCLLVIEEVGLEGRSAS